MDTTKQAGGLFKTWTDTQVKVWDSWVQALRGSAGFNATEGWEHVQKTTLETWEDAVRKALDAQSEWARVWTEGFVGGERTPEEVAEGARVVQEMVRSWIEAQQQLWEKWFDLAKKVTPATFTRGFEKVTEAWQQALRKATEAQREWGAAARETAPSRSAKASA
ncbi:MAG: hypothetical protein ACRDJ4_01260 [Actinomycetota bacterium]